MIATCSYFYNTFHLEEQLPCKVPWVTQQDLFFWELFLMVFFVACVALFRFLSALDECFLFNFCDNSRMQDFDATWLFLLQTEEKYMQ